MLSNIDNEQTLLDIEILAVQIDTHRQLQRETKSRELHEII